MRIFSKNLRLQDVTIMYLTALAALMVILVASYQAPTNAIEVSSLKSKPSSPLPPLPMPFRVPLDPRGELQLAWNISYSDQEVYMELRVMELRHGVVLGMSDRGELTNADLVVLWDSGANSYFGVSSPGICVICIIFQIIEFKRIWGVKFIKSQTKTTLASQKMRISSRFPNRCEIKSFYCFSHSLFHFFLYVHL